MKHSTAAVVISIAAAPLVGFALGVLVLACMQTTAPETPTPADVTFLDGTAPTDGAMPFERRICHALAVAGCPWAAAVTCAQTLRSNVLPADAGYLTPWAACIYQNGSARGCSVPCE